MKRFDPDAAPPAAPAELALPTMERGQHFLFHSQPGDIWGGYDGPATNPDAPLIGNILIIAQCSLLREAKRILAEVQAVLPRAVMTAWLKGEKSKSMWAVHLANATPAEVAAAQPFITRPEATRSAVEKRVSLTRNAAGTPSAQRTAQVQRAASAAPESAAEKVRRMASTMFCFLCESDDTAACAAVQARFITSLEARSFTGDWRTEWARWWAAEKAAPAAAPVATPAPAAQFSATTRNILASLASFQS